MCYGGLDPKYQMREIEARVKTYGFDQDTRKQAAPDAAPGLMARVRGFAAWLLRKDARNV
jgi:hypothetical protein